MGIKSSFLIGWRSISRRKAKNLSVILAVALGVTLLVGIQITTDTLENAFLTSLLQGEGEVDIRISNSTSGAYLTASELEIIEDLIPDAIGIMPELSMQLPSLVVSQFDPNMELAGIFVNYSDVFGDFYDWKTGNKFDLDSLLIDNRSMLLSSDQAKKFGLDKNAQLPFILTTEFINLTTSFTPELERVELTVIGFFDSTRPGIGSQYSGAILNIESLQSWLSLQDPLQNTDLVSAYLIAFKSDHFTEEISKEFLETKVEQLEAELPEEIDINTGESYKIYQITSPRLIFFGFASFFIMLLSTILSSLGLLITLTGLLLITNVQLMSVEDREFQTGVLRAVGENQRGIFQSIIIENLFQGIIGGIIGLFGGLAFGQGVAVYLVTLFGTGEFSVQPVISQEAIVLSVVVGIILSIITGILPALRASRVNIVDALRGIKVKFEIKSSRNLVALGILMILLGVFISLNNGVFDDTTQVFWSNQGWDTLSEWRNILLGFGSFTIGVGFVLSRFINRVKAFNITAISLWATPTFLFTVAMDNWIIDVGNLSIDILIIGIGEIIIGSILLVSLNLPIVMRSLRKFLIKIKGMKGVAEISPALISSHITRSTLTFAIFAIILTLNVVVATLIPTNLGTVTELEADSKGIDFIIFLNKPEAVLNTTSFSEEIYKIDSKITDVIGLKTFKPNQDFTKFIALKDPSSSEFDMTTDLLPIGTGEFKSIQIRGNATNYIENNWRYAFYLSSFPDGIRELYTSDLSDNELLDLSKQSWDQLFNISYQMAAYNVSSNLLSILSGESDISDLEVGSEGEGNSSFSDGDPLKDKDPLRDDNGTIIKNPIVFTDSFLLPIGMQVWVPMNVSSIGLSNYQAFTIGGGFDNQRAGGFPLGAGLTFGGGASDFGTTIGSIYMPEYWANQTNFLGNVNNQSLTSREADQYNAYLIKTSLAINSFEIEQIAQSIQGFTNTNDEGYRLIANDNFYVASTVSTYSSIEQTLELTSRITSFLQIYVTFGLAIGAVGMGVISVRNVAERKREIGMMRAIGFSKAEVILSVLLELVVLGIIGLVIGVMNGLIISQGFANMQNVVLIIPWSQIGIYLSFIVLIAIGAGSIPAFVASRIPPAEALRYVG